MPLNINPDFNFTTDCGYLQGYNKGRSSVDPDIYSPTLRLYQQTLYSRRTPSGIELKLEQGRNIAYDYLVWNGIRFGSDNIINMCERYKLSWDREAEIENYDDKIRDYIVRSYTIGAEIIFPKHKKSVNTERGWNHSIKDRFDLTLECIKRFYEGKDSPLYPVLKTDEDFFKLFVNFKGYVDFFFLNDLVSGDYQRVNLFLGTYEDLFIRSPLPQDKQEWEQLRDRQMKFLERRNVRIRDFIKNYK